MSESHISTLKSHMTQPTSSTAYSRSRGDDDSDIDDDEIFAQLEEEIENGAGDELRDKGLARLKREMESLKQMKDTGHGKYDELIDEKEVISVSAREKYCVIHFYHSNFKRCQIMDKHLAALAPRYFNTRFLRVFVENVPWLVEKLAIKVLPCVVCFIDGVSKDRMIGFEDLGNSDQFETATLEWRLLNCGVIQKDVQVHSGINYGTAVGSTRQKIRRNQDDEDSDFDLDD